MEVDLGCRVVAMAHSWKCEKCPREMEAFHFPLLKYLMHFARNHCNGILNSLEGKTKSPQVARDCHQKHSLLS